jgi:hypothetical protein
MPWANGFNDSHLFLPVVEAGKSQFNVSADLIFGWLVDSYLIT